MSRKYCNNLGFCSPDAHWEFSHFFIDKYEAVFSEEWNCVVCEESIELPAPMKYFEHWKAKMKLENPWWDLLNLEYQIASSSKKAKELEEFEFSFGYMPGNYNIVSTLEDCWYTRTRYIDMTKDFKRPSVQQYKKGIEPSQRNRMTPTLRLAILERDKFRCCYCGRNAYDGVKLHVDHIVPVSKGGKTIKGNLQTLCEECNIAKRDKIIDHT